MTSNNPSTEIKEFIYKQVSYTKWIRDFAVSLEGKVKNDMIVFAPGMGEGFAKSYFLENGLTACVHNYYLNTDLQLTIFIAFVICWVLCTLFIRLRTSFNAPDISNNC